MSGLVSFQILQMVYLCQRKQQDEEGEEEGKKGGLGAAELWSSQTKSIKWVNK